MQDGRIKVYIHVADPTRYVQPRSMLDKYVSELHSAILFIRSSVNLKTTSSAILIIPYVFFIIFREAMRRGTSVFLPTATYPMFPENLAMQGMSLKQGEVCNAGTVSVVLHSDGR